MILGLADNYESSDFTEYFQGLIKLSFEQAFAEEPYKTVCTTGGDVLTTIDLSLEECDSDCVTERVARINGVNADYYRRKLDG